MRRNRGIHIFTFRMEATGIELGLSAHTLAPNTPWVVIMLMQVNVHISWGVRVSVMFCLDPTSRKFVEFRETPRETRGARSADKCHLQRQE